MKFKDPLFRLFEHFLMTRTYENSAAFTKQLAENYLAYLDSSHAHMPFEVRNAVLEDLASEAHEMLVKRMYGNEIEQIKMVGLVLRYDDGKVTDPTPLHMPEIAPKP
jgi:hypothetical protein